ncbi:MAG: hypothetical protein ACRDS9_17370, partial [Pseudonocardiaceae bacterium]
SCAPRWVRWTWPSWQPRSASGRIHHSDFDVFHMVKLAMDALDSVRHQVWQSARKLCGKRAS